MCSCLPFKLFGREPEVQHILMSMASLLLHVSKKNSSKNVFWVIQWPGFSPFRAPVEPLAYLNYCLSVSLFPPLLCGFLWGQNHVLFIFVF